jgi:hypothetical protein
MSSEKRQHFLEYSGLLLQIERNSLKVTSAREKAKEEIKFTEDQRVTHAKAMAAAQHAGVLKPPADNGSSSSSSAAAAASVARDTEERESGTGIHSHTFTLTLHRR